MGIALKGCPYNQASKDTWLVLWNTFTRELWLRNHCITELN